MKPHFTHSSSRGENYDRQRMQPGRETPIGPIINWRALWLRTWLALKRWVAELWYLFSRRTAGPLSSYQAPRPSVASRKWMMPAFKVAAALVFFMYVLQRDIQFSIHMKAPLGQPAAQAGNLFDGSAEQMSMVPGIAVPTSSRMQAKEDASMAANAVEHYIERFAQVAQTEMQKYGVPASVKMAQALLESQAGQSVAARVDNNHFGTRLGGQPYESAWRNWREHSLLLLHRYGDLLEHGNDYRSWARGLEAAGYSTEQNYANQLLELIDRFHLEQLDEPTI